MHTPSSKVLPKVSTFECDLHITKSKKKKLKFVSYDPHPCAGARVGSDIITLDGLVMSQALF